MQGEPGEPPQSFLILFMNELSLHYQLSSEILQLIDFWSALINSALRGFEVVLCTVLFNNQWWELCICESAWYLSPGQRTRVQGKMRLLPANEIEHSARAAYADACVWAIRSGSTRTFPMLLLFHAFTIALLKVQARQAGGSYFLVANRNWQLLQAK